MADEDLGYIAEALRSLAVPIDSLVEDPANTRIHEPRNIEVLKGSAARFRQQKPVVFDPATRVIIAGNGFFRAMKDLGRKFIAAVPSDLQPADQAAFAIADNRSAELSRWDFSALQSQLDALSPDFDVAVEIGFTAEEMKAFRPAEPKAPPEEFPEYNEGVSTTYQCPKCKYEWSGKPK